jgi:hypothetical protein
MQLGLGAEAVLRLGGLGVHEEASQQVNLTWG